MLDRLVGWWKRWRVKEHDYEVERALYKMEGGAPPEIVAEAIFKAVTEEGPVHVPVGDDAEIWVKAHANSDEWASIFAEPDEQRFVDRFTDLCGADVLNPPSLYARRRTSVD